MKNIELQRLLQAYPDDMPVKLMLDHETRAVINLDNENILHTSSTAYINDAAPYDTWDCEDGKIELGDGPQYLLINPIIT